MPRKRKSFTRKPGNKDDVLFVIACEGNKTEPSYFNDFNKRFLAGNPSVHVEILDKAHSGHSAPDQVLRDLAEFQKTYRLKYDDQLWLVVDRDHQSWEEGMLDKIAKTCKQKGISLAVSNPCFEIWLLFHYEDPSSYSEAFRQNLLQNRKQTRHRTFIQKYLEAVVGRYKPDNPVTEDFLGYTEHAVDCAKREDKSHERWPNDLGSRVYQLIEALQVHKR